MRRSRQKKLRRGLAWAALGVIGADLAVYALLARPLRRSLAEQRQEFAAARREIRQEEERVAFLENALAALPASDDELRKFLSEHVAPRRRAFSRAASLLEKLSAQSGVTLASVDYHPPEGGGQPWLEPLGLNAAVAGSFPKLVDFTHALETAPELVVLRGFSWEATDNGDVALKLSADMYVTP